MAYCTTTDLDLAYGRDNLCRWSDPDNNKDVTTIADRKTWAINNATDYIDARLLNGPYEVPFEEPYPNVIVFMTSIWAGILLHDARAVTSESPDQVARQRMQFEKYVRQIMRGQIKFPGLDRKKNHPSALRREDYDASDSGREKRCSLY